MKLLTPHESHAHSQCAVTVSEPLFLTWNERCMLLSGLEARVNQYQLRARAAERPEDKKLEETFERAASDLRKRINNCAEPARPSHFWLWLTAINLGAALVNIFLR